MKHIEDNHQKMIFDWANYQRLSELKHKVKSGERVGQYLVASANGGKRNKQEAARMKAQGVSAGFPDIQLCLAAGAYHGLFIELKRPLVKGQSKPVVSQLQKEWLARLNHTGYLAVVCYGFEEAKETITRYLAGEL